VAFVQSRNLEIY